jgi:hypothetical protein
MNKLIHQLYYDDKITKEVAMLLLDQLNKSKEKRRYY